MTQRNVRSLVVTSAITAFALLPTVPALAHGDASVGEGELVLGIGFLDEPAFMGSPNAVQLTVTRAGRALTDLRPGDVQVEVSFGDETSEPMQFEPLFGVPGDYVAPFMPSQPGKYTFRITGTIDGEKIDEEMTSGDTTFATVEDPATMTFPPTDAPTNDELATRIEQEAARSATYLTAAEAAANSAEATASSARLVGLVGITVGASGLIVAIVAIRRKNRPGQLG